MRFLCEWHTNATALQEALVMEKIVEIIYIAEKPNVLEKSAELCGCGLYVTKLICVG